MRCITFPISKFIYSSWMTGSPQFRQRLVIFFWEILVLIHVKYYQNFISIRCLVIVLIMFKHPLWAFYYLLIRGRLSSTCPRISLFTRHDNYAALFTFMTLSSSGCYGDCGTTLGCSAADEDADASYGETDAWSLRQKLSATPSDSGSTCNLIQDTTSLHPDSPRDNSTNCDCY